MQVKELGFEELHCPVVSPSTPAGAGVPVEC